MKLIKRGVDPKTAIRHAKCNNCSSEYEFTASDPEVKRTSDQRDGDFFTFDCVVCHRQVYASAGPIPPGYR